MKGSSDAPPTPASTPPPVVPPEKESEIIEIDIEDEPTPALETEGQLILKCSLSVFIWTKNTTKFFQGFRP